MIEINKNYWSKQWKLNVQNVILENMSKTA